MNDTHFDNEPHETWLFSKGTVVACAVVAVIGLLMLTGHRAHVLGALPYLLLLACPLMHIFMHGGHGHRSHYHAHHADSAGETTDGDHTESSTTTEQGGR